MAAKLTSLQKMAKNLMAPKPKGKRGRPKGSGKGNDTPTGARPMIERLKAHSSVFQGDDGPVVIWANTFPKRRKGSDHGVPPRLIVSVKDTEEYLAAVQTLSQDKDWLKAKIEENKANRK